jgi:hypothetical protein
VCRHKQGRSGQKGLLSRWWAALINKRDARSRPFIQGHGFSYGVTAKYQRAGMRTTRRCTVVAAGPAPQSAPLDMTNTCHVINALSWIASSTQFRVLMLIWRIAVRTQQNLMRSVQQPDYCIVHPNLLDGNISIRSIRGNSGSFQPAMN